jgi:DNA-binding MarR family transcriptional regulator
MLSAHEFPLAVKMAELTYRLLEHCQEKQEYIAGKLNVSVSEFKCLRSFRDATILSVKAIAERMSLTSSRLTRIIDGLVEKNLVTRSINTEDRRLMDIELTPEGRNLAQQLNRDYSGVHEQILSNLPPESRRAVIQALEDLAYAMSTWVSHKDALIPKPMPEEVEA